MDDHGLPRGHGNMPGVTDTGFYPGGPGPPPSRRYESLPTLINLLDDTTELLLDCAVAEKNNDTSITTTTVTTGSCLEEDDYLMAEADAACKGYVPPAAHRSLADADYAFNSSGGAMRQRFLSQSHGQLDTMVLTPTAAATGLPNARGGSRLMSHLRRRRRSHPIMLRWSDQEQARTQQEQQQQQQQQHRQRQQQQMQRHKSVDDR